MTDPPDRELYAAKALRNVLQLYISTGKHPYNLSLSAMPRAVSVYTQKGYVGRDWAQDALTDLSAWIANREGGTTMQQAELDRLHPESLRTLQALVRLHGAARVIAAVRAIETRGLTQ